MTKKKEELLQVKWEKMQVVRIDSNAPFNMLFKHELNARWQCVTIDNQIREGSKRLKENKKRKENQYNINLYSIITIIFIIIVMIVFTIVVIVLIFIIIIIIIIIIFFFKVNFFL